MYFIFKYKINCIYVFQIHINKFKYCARFFLRDFHDIYIRIWDSGYSCQCLLTVEVYLLLKSSCHILQWATNCRTTCLKHFCCSKPMRTFMASRIDIYSQLLISTIRISDISNSIIDITI